MAEIETQMTSYPSNGQVTPAYVAQPSQPGSYPGVVLIQEWWGLVPHIKDVAGRFAREGYVALAPDLYHGKQAGEPDEARKLAMELDRERAVHEIDFALRYLRSLEIVYPKKIGLVGWCMGGSLAIATAAASQEPDAVVAFYGMPSDLSIVRDIQAPLLGLYAEDDHGIPVERVRELEQKLESAGTPHEVHIYEGAGHAFFNDTRPHIYNETAAQDAWSRTLAWFERHLV